MTTHLSVNVNKIALIRNARGENLPNLTQVAIDIENFGAAGITVHPRPDERHIRYSDVPALKQVIRTELNVEGNPTPRFTELVLAHRPHQVTLVPDKPDALTSTEGWDTVAHADYLRPIIAQFKAAGIRVSIFVNAVEQMVSGAHAVGADRVEFYTGHYARTYDTPQCDSVMAAHARCSQLAHDLGLGVNAGHDLNLHNLAFYKQHMPYLHEVSIGHALVSDALYYGLHNTVQQYLQALA